MRTALYLRVSTDQQTTENQRLPLLREIEHRGWSLAPEHTYEDFAISGAKNETQRPRYAAMLQAVDRKEFDVIMAYDLTRLSRSTVDLLLLAQRVDKAGVNLFTMREHIDTTTPSGRFFFHVMAALGQFERENIASRIRAGMDRARAQGKMLGRPDRQRLSDNVRANVCEHILSGTMTEREIAKLAGVSKGMVGKIKYEMINGVTQ